MHHIFILESNEEILVNSYIPGKCPRYSSTSFKKNGKSKNNIQRYKYFLCNKTFSVLINFFDNYKLAIDELFSLKLVLIRNSKGKYFVVYVRQSKQHLYLHMNV